MRVLSIDPGPHVGVATYDEGTHAAWATDPAGAYTSIEEWLAWAEVVVCEDFHIGGARGRDSNVTIEMIGVVKYLCRRAGVRLVMQSPNQRAPETLLRPIGWWTPGSGDHQRSASCHLAAFLHGSGYPPFRQLLLSSGAEEVSHGSR